MRRLLEHQRGAIYVEFLAAFMPVFALFMCIAQLADLYTTRLVVRHAAYRTARAGAVVFPDNPELYQVVGKADEVRAAGYAVLAGKRSISEADIEIPGGTEHYERGQLVEVVIHARTRCIFPIANRILCNPWTATQELQARATLPAHTASYEY